MSQDSTDPRTSISQVNERVVPVNRVKTLKSGTLEPKVNQIKRAMASLVAASEDPPLHLRGDFEVTGLGHIRTGTLKKFHLMDENTEAGKGFSMAFEHRGSAPMRHVTPSEHVHKAARKALIKHGLDFRSVGSDVAYKIEVQPVVPSYVTVLAGADGKTIAITLSNIGMLGETTYRLGPEHVDRKLIDALVELITHGKRDFYDLVARLPRRRG